LALPLAAEEVTDVPGRWSVERAQAWFEPLPWLVGCNYYPATAINAIEMWQASSFDPEQIEKELGWAEGLGFNTLRVYLHDLVWHDDAEGLYRRMDRFLGICEEHGMKPFFVFFDDCHYPDPKLGEQPLPVARWHNSGWLNSPGRELALRYAAGGESEAERARLKGYVVETMRRFGDDPRVLMWELYNEPGRGDGPQDDIGEKSNRLVLDSWKWAREAAPSQPVTSTTRGSIGERNIAINRANADVHSIHCYGGPENLRGAIEEYRRDGRPVFVTEWLARKHGSTVAECLPVMKELGVPAIQWGFVSGKSGTIWPWSSRKRQGPDGEPLTVDELRAAGEVVRPGEEFPEPELWFHDLLRMDGTPFDEAELEWFRKLTGAPRAWPEGGDAK